METEYKKVFQYDFQGNTYEDSVSFIVKEGFIELGNNNEIIYENTIDYKIKQMQSLIILLKKYKKNNLK